MRQRDFHSRFPLKKKKRKEKRKKGEGPLLDILVGSEAIHLFILETTGGMGGGGGSIIGNGSGFGSAGRETERGLRIICNSWRISPI